MCGETVIVAEVWLSGRIVGSVILIIQGTKHREMDHLVTWKLARSLISRLGSLAIFDCGQSDCAPTSSLNKLVVSSQPVGFCPFPSLDRRNPSPLASAAMAILAVHPKEQGGVFVQAANPGNLAGLMIGWS